MIKKAVEDKPREMAWNLVWGPIGQRNSKNNATGLTPYRLTYGQDIVLPLELVVSSLRVAKQHRLQPKEYSQAMFQELELADKNRLMALENI